MSRSSIQNHLIELGMTEREAKLYAAMLGRSESTATELYLLCGISRNKAYETLNQMVTKGFCQERMDGRKRFYRPTQPEVLSEALTHQWQQDFNEKVSTLREKKEIFREMENLSLSAAGLDHLSDKIEVIRNGIQINLRLIDLIRNSTSEILYYTRSPKLASQSKTLYEEQINVQKEALKRGVKLKCVYRYEPELWDWLEKNVLKQSMESGEEARITDILPVKMLIFDKKKVVIAMPMDPDEKVTDFTALVIDDPGFVQMCLINFYFVWEQARTYEEWKKLRMKATSSGKE